MSESLQDRYTPRGTCFGCGPLNERGLRIKSFAEGEEVVCDWTPSEHHEAYPGILSGGICGTLLDCHSNMTAAHHLRSRGDLGGPLFTVTAEFHVKLLKPTPMDGPVRLRARVVESSGRKAVVDATLEAGGSITATCHGVFVAVREGHPAYHGW